MEFVVPCLIDISDFILTSLNGHYEGQGSSSAISESSFKFYYEFMFYIFMT